MGTIDSWSSIETTIRQRLDSIECDRRYCAVCARQGPSLSRCFGCQMVYYCGEEHQIEDWSNEHGQKCAQLEWVALGEFIRALPAQPPLPELGEKWPLSLKDIPSWIQWFSIRTNIVHMANNTANIFENLVHLTDKRQPNHQNAVDGLLAAVTDLLTHVLTIGKAILSFGLQPQTRSLLIHILNGFTHDDLLDNEHSDSTLPSRFHELLNMFPDNKGVELVIVIGDDNDNDDDDQNNDETNENDPDHASLPQAKLRPDRLIITTRNKRSRLNLLGNKRQNPDLLVYFNAAHLLMGKNRPLFDAMLTKQCPTLLTFEDEEEFHRSRMYFSNRNMPIKQAGSNPFGSMMIRQRPNRPNSTYSTNSYQILLNSLPANRSDERASETMSLYSHQSSIGIQHDQIGSFQQQQQPLNPGLKQVNGRIHIQSPPMSHKTQANKNGTLLDTHVHIGSTTASTTVQSSQPTNNNMRQPTVPQRRHHSTSIPSMMTNGTTTTTTTMNSIDINRFDNHKPQPKPRLSLVKSNQREHEEIQTESSTKLIQQYKSLFEPSNLSRPSISQTQTTYQTVLANKVTCLDDIIVRQRVEPRSPPPIAARPIEIQPDDRTMSAAQSPREVRLEQRTTAINKGQAPSPPKSTMIDSKKMPVPLSSLLISNEIHSDQRTVNNRPSPPVFIEHPTIDSRISNMISPTPTETTIDQPIVSITNRPAPPPPPVTSSTTTTATNGKNEVIYTEVIKNHERITSPSPSSPTPTPTPTPTSTPTAITTTTITTNDMVKSPLSPSRSFVIPTKSPSILSSKNSSFNVQRTSRPVSSTNFSYQSQKSRPNPSMMNADRISLYSQRSTKQADVGVTIKNLSECIDRVGIVFDESQRPSEPQSAGLTTVDLIREQLSSTSMVKPNESLLDKLYKSNSSTRLSNKNTANRKSFTIASPRSKSQQATRTSAEPSEPVPVVEPPAKITPTPLISTQNVRRTTGVFLPFTPKNIQDIPITPAIINESSSTSTGTSVYQNIDLQISNNVDVKKPAPLAPVPNFTLKQQIGPVCTGVPRPFRKPTAIIEPSPVVVPSTSTPTATPTPAPALMPKRLEEPNYVNLMMPPPIETTTDSHIYSNENGIAVNGSSQSNSYTSRTSSIYSSTDKPSAAAVSSEPLYAIAHVAPTSTNNVLNEQLVEYDSFDDELVVGHQPIANENKPNPSHDNTDEDSFDDDEEDENQVGHRQHVSPAVTAPSKNISTSFFRSTINRLTRSNKSLDRVGLATNDSPPTEHVLEINNPSNQVDNKTKKTLRSIKARHEAKKTGVLIPSYTGDDDTTSIDSNCSTQTATSLNKSSKASSHQRFRLFRRKIEKEFASDTEAEKHQTEQRRKKWNKKMSNETANELKNQRLLMMTDDDEDVAQQIQMSLTRQSTKQHSLDDETHIYDHIVHEEIGSQSSRMGKLSHETHFKSPTITLDEIRSEIKAEIAARQEGPTIMTTSNTTAITNSSSSSNLTLQKKRSKSVTFLDELLVDENDDQSSNIGRKLAQPVKPPPTARRIEKGDARSICGALTGTGPIRGIIKAANNDITGTTAPISPSTATAAIYLSGTSIDTRCTSPKAHERATQRPLSTYTVGSARFYDGTPSSMIPTTSNLTSSTSTPSSNQRPLLMNGSSQSDRRPTAKVSPFQTKSSSNETSSPNTTVKSVLKKPVRPSRNPTGPSDINPIPTPSISEGVGAVSKRLQSNF